MKKSLCVYLSPVLFTLVAQTGVASKFEKLRPEGSDTPLVFKFLSANVLTNGTGFTDLPAGVEVFDFKSKALAKNLKKSSILAIGESAHGSKRYAETQLKFVQEAVTKYGHRLIMMEFISDDRSLNQYLQTCDGNLREIMYNNSWIENSKERADLYQWICHYNLEHPQDQVRIKAVDPQTPWLNISNVRDVLEEIAPDLLSKDYIKVRDNCFGASFNHQIEWAFSQEATDYFNTGTLPEDKHKACLAGMESLQNELARHLKSNVHLQKFRDVKQELSSLKAWQEKSYYYFSDTKKALTIREEAFADAVIYYWKRNNFRYRPALLLAHNLHIAKTKLISNSLNDPFGGMEPVGMKLKQKLGSGYRAMALSGYKISAMFVGNYPVPTSENSIDFELKKLSLPYLMLDTKAKWVKDHTWHSHEESIVNGREYDLTNAFNVVIYQEISAASAFLGKPN